MSKKSWFILYFLFVIGLLLTLALIKEPKWHVENELIYLQPVPTTANKVVDDILSASVMVKVPGGNGSGVVFKNHHYSFVWTAAHVVLECKEKDVPLELSKWEDCWVKQPVCQNGRIVGEDSYLAQVLKFSEIQDIAILRIKKESWEGRSVKFAGTLPLIGEEVYHVGSINGKAGFQSVTGGLVNFVGRLRFNCNEDYECGLEFDQVTVNAHYGSSGGGIFRKSNGECIGLLTEFLTSKTVGQISCIVPARRLEEFAKINKCEWALDSSILFDPDKVGKVVVDTLEPQKAKIPEIKKIMLPPSPIIK